MIGLMGGLSQAPNKMPPSNWLKYFEIKCQAQLFGCLVAR